ncbi:hypothetical protein B296_00045291 [Ensete ventricosum]|uniref:Uncharacterized protein n=1 Tax=Ensete ventricosum TaxID=4639 RepID=A0A426YS81_ENSVE|nr:hypothetical protein B296_00045291 [Ensete ventricosum]
MFSSIVESGAYVIDAVGLGRNEIADVGKRGGNGEAVAVEGMAGHRWLAVIGGRATGASALGQLLWKGRKKGEGTSVVKEADGGRVAAGWLRRGRCGWKEVVAGGRWLCVGGAATKEGVAGRMRLRLWLRRRGR